MPKNTKGGKGNRKGKNSNAQVNAVFVPKDDEQEYALVIDLRGDCNFGLQLPDGTKTVGKLRGTLHKKVWVNKEAYVLISKRDFEDKKCDIIHVYPPEHYKYIRREFREQNSDDTLDEVEFENDEVHEIEVVEEVKPKKKNKKEVSLLDDDDAGLASTINIDDI